MVATHPDPPANDYHMTQLCAYAVTHSMDSFRSGAGAYRNAREWTQQLRDGFIANANGVASRRSIEARSFNTSGNNSKVSSAVV